MDMKKSLVIVCSLVVVLSAVIVDSLAEERDASLYAGVKSCKMCHKKDDVGNQFAKWSAAPHSKAYESLASAESKKIAAKLGIADAQKSPKCLKCHSTAYNFTEKDAESKISVEEGVTCEACHGPGKNYKSKTTMKDAEKCVAKGMIKPATKSCVLCHNEKSPTWKPDRLPPWWPRGRVRIPTPKRPSRPSPLPRFRRWGNAEPRSWDDWMIFSRPGPATMNS